MADEQPPPKRDVNEPFTLDASNPSSDPDGPLAHLLSMPVVADVGGQSGNPTEREPKLDELESDRGRTPGTTGGDGRSGTGDDLPDLADVGGLEDLAATTTELPFDAAPADPLPPTTISSWAAEVVDMRPLDERPDEGSLVEGSLVEDSSVEGRLVEGSLVEGSLVEGSLVEGSSVEGSSVGEDSSVEGSSVGEDSSVDERPVGERAAGNWSVDWRPHRSEPAISPAAERRSPETLSAPRWPREPIPVRLDLRDDPDPLQTFEVGGNLRFSTEAGQRSDGTWLPNGHDQPYPAALVPHAVPAPVSPNRSVRVPGEERRRGALPTALIEITERRWFWASVAGVLGLILFSVLAVGNIVPNPLATVRTDVVADDRVPAAPPVGGATETSEDDTSSSTGAGSGGLPSAEPTTSSASTTSTTVTTSTRRIITTARPTVRPTVRSTTAGPTSPASSSTSSSVLSTTTVSTSTTATTVTSSTTGSSSPTTTTTTPDTTTDTTAETTTTTEGEPTTSPTTPTP